MLRHPPVELQHLGEGLGIVWSCCSSCCSSCAALWEGLALSVSDLQVPATPQLRLDCSAQAGAQVVPSAPDAEDAPLAERLHLKNRRLRH